jgi:hypothetical protein
MHNEPCALDNGRGLTRREQSNQRLCFLRCLLFKMGSNLRFEI